MNHEESENFNEVNVPITEEQQNEAHFLNETEQLDHEVVPSKDLSQLSLEELINLTIQIISKQDIRKINKVFREIKENFYHKLSLEKVKNDENPKELKKLQNLQNEFDRLQRLIQKEKTEFIRKQEKTFAENLAKRREIIERLKNLYQNPPESGILKTFRDIKTDWHNAGPIARKDVEDVFRTYRHHLQQFYKFLEYFKELQQLDLEHNLEQRKAIIERAKTLLNEKNLFKAINEIQYLHKLWKEEAEPVAEEFRESTWQEFKQISDQIIAKKNEFLKLQKQSEEENLKQKKQIIDELKNLPALSLEANSKWRKVIERAEELKDNFLKLGKVPKAQSKEIWDEFKAVLKEFNTQKNKFFKELKRQQLENLSKKQALIDKAKSFVDSDSWDEANKVFKEIQTEWKKIGHVPKNVSDKIWEEFKNLCNQFYERYKNRNITETNEWEQNFLEKQKLIEEAKNLHQTEMEKQKKLDALKSLIEKWQDIGKVPKDKMQINNQFNDLKNKILHQLQLSHHDIFVFNEEVHLNQLIKNQDKSKVEDELRKLRKSIQELEQEISIIENNYASFNFSSKNNPIAKEFESKLAGKKEHLEHLRTRFKHLSRLDVHQSQQNQTPTNREED